LTHAFTEVEMELIQSFKLKRKSDFGEVSRWFSYGSNLNPWYFEEKMRERGSPLRLEAVKKGIVMGFGRVLDNRSSTHGLAYAIHPGSGSVHGITHEVPSDQLPFFLRMEGVLDDDFHVSNRRRYEVIEVDVHADPGSPNSTGTAFSLRGDSTCEGSERENRAREHYVEADKYVRAALSGAQTQAIDEAPFLADFGWLGRIRQIP